MRRIATHTDFPGPLLPRKNRRAPPVSWWVTPRSALPEQTLAEEINKVLVASPDAGTSPQISTLIQRILNSNALDLDQQSPLCAPDLLQPTHRIRVLVIDECARSPRSSATASERRKAFDCMIEAVRTEHPDAEFWLARTADQGRGNWLSISARALPFNIRRLNARYSLCAAVRHVDHVYTIAASEGMYALLSGKPLHVFGSPFYAGWGLTHDYHPLSGRTARPTRSALFDVAFLRLSRYLDPATHAPGSLDTLLDSVELQRAVALRFQNLRNVAGIRFQWWKRPFATPFLTAGGGSLRWTHRAEDIQPGEYAALWGARSVAGLPEGGKFVRIEDGFIHSTGLGSDMIAPRSQVIDMRGIYFDPSRPSDLTSLLNEAVFSGTELSRAAALRTEIVQAGLTKYNLGRRKPTWKAPAGKRVALVPGQVADDASIRLGTRAICTADALLREVRERHPDTFIVYKPHPDVLSGNRSGLIDAQRLADVVDVDSDLISLIDVSDEVHTLSSLAGFDALLRGKTVYTYGLPFYAGWGLTRDEIEPIPWRQRNLSLDMLTAGVLLRYPLYWDWRLQLFTTPEAVVSELARFATRPLERVRGSRSRPFLKIVRWTRNALQHLLWRQQRATTEQGS
jgi:capsular polysaccharide export protein